MVVQILRICFDDKVTTSQALRCCASNLRFEPSAVLPKAKLANLRFATFPFTQGRLPGWNTMEILRGFYIRWLLNFTYALYYRIDPENTSPFVPKSGRGLCDIYKKRGGDFRELCRKHNSLLQKQAENGIIYLQSFPLREVKKCISHT